MFHGHVAGNPGRITGNKQASLITGERTRDVLLVESSLLSLTPENPQHPLKRLASVQSWSLEKSFSHSSTEELEISPTANEPLPRSALQMRRGVSAVSHCRVASCGDAKLHSPFWYTWFWSRSDWGSSVMLRLNHAPNFQAGAILMSNQWVTHLECLHEGERIDVLPAPVQNL